MLNPVSQKLKGQRLRSYVIDGDCFHQNPYALFPEARYICKYMWVCLCERVGESGHLRLSFQLFFKLNSGPHSPQKILRWSWWCCSYLCNNKIYQKMQLNLTAIGYANPQLSLFDRYFRSKYSKAIPYLTTIHLASAIYHETLRHVWSIFCYIK